MDIKNPMGKLVRWSSLLFSSLTLGLNIESAQLMAMPMFFLDVPIFPPFWPLQLCNTLLFKQTTTAAGSHSIWFINLFQHFSVASFRLGCTLFASQSQWLLFGKWYFVSYLYTSKSSQTWPFGLNSCTQKFQHHLLEAAHNDVLAGEWCRFGALPLELSVLVSHLGVTKAYAIVRDSFF